LIYPRTPDLHRDLSVAIRTNVSESRARATFTARPGAVPESNVAPERSYEGYAGSSTDSLSSALRFAFAFFSTEGSMAYGFSDSIAIGSWLSLELAGVELRLQPLSERDGAPFSASLSLGAAHVGIAPSFATDLLREGFGARAGLDLGVFIGRDELLLGAYASYIRRRREFSDVPDSIEDNRLNYGDAAPSPVSELMVVRNELKLSVPIGYALHLKSAAVIFGIVPEWTLDASIDDWRCYDCDAAYDLTSFEQHFAIYVTLGAEGWSD
jgi:hypothetical protein